jgi:hypothetical protein
LYIVVCTFDVESATVISTKTNNITKTSISNILMRFRGVIVIYLNGIIIDLIVHREVLEELPELRAGPGMSAKIGSIGPATLEAEGLRAPWACSGSMGIVREGLSLQLGKNILKVGGKVGSDKRGHLKEVKKVRRPHCEDTND